MRIAVTGASGLIGQALVPHLRTAGHEVVRLVRRPPATADERAWVPGRDLDPAVLAGVEAVVNLSGANLAQGRWTDRRKQQLRDSRIGPTRVLAEAIARMSLPPPVLVSSSAVGYYGDRGDEPLTEASPAGDGFLARLCVEWEQATAPAEAAGIRVVHTRSGIVLSAAAGALAKMLKPFKAGIGGVLGSGSQYVSWITMDDLLAAITRALTDDALRGAINTVAPSPVTNRQFTRSLGRVLHRPTVASVPAFVLRLLFGEMAGEALLASTRAVPQRLLAAGFRFSFPDLEPALRQALGRRPL
ncbi:MAG TPA: TIGR01777 family oxidoreductase [Vicinamibacteria bacterium]|nr:TIGR01777 family oxidoreductase [Vicinamibacteria bacterium]